MLICIMRVMTVDPQEMSTWRSGVKCAMGAASQLPGRGLLMWMMPLHLHVNQKSDHDEDNYYLLSLVYVPVICIHDPHLWG